MATTHTSPKSRRWWVVAIALLAVSLAGFSQVMNFSLRGQSSESVSTPGDQRYVVCYGLVTLRNGITQISPTQPGRVAAVLVQEGEFVPANTVLLRMVDDVPRARLTQAQIALDEAKAELADAKAKLPEQRDLQLKQQSLSVKIAQDNRDAKKIAYEHQSRIASGQSGLVSQATADAARKEYEAAQRMVDIEEAKLRQLQLRDPQTEIRKLEAGVNTRQALRDEAQALVDQFAIKTTQAGTVLRITVAPGDTLAPSMTQPAIDFAAEGPRFIRAEVEQAYARQIVNGLHATIYDDTNAPGVWTGHIVHVGDWYSNRRNVLADPSHPSDVRTMECLIAVDSGKMPLRINQRVRVHIDVPG